MSPRRNWDSPTPSFASECAPPPEPKGGGGGLHTRLRVRGCGSPTGEKLITLPTLWSIWFFSPLQSSEVVKNT